MLACHCCSEVLPADDDADVIGEMGSSPLQLDHIQVLTTEVELPSVFPPGPKASCAQMYALSLAGPLTGEPLKCGRVLVVKPSALQVTDAKLVVYPKGFTIMAAHPSTVSTPESVPEADEHSFVWSPFSAVERYTNQLLAGAVFSQGLSMFKLTTFRRAGGVHNAIFFGTTSIPSSSSDEERTKWIDVITAAIGSVTESLFPLQHAITSTPVPGVRSTSSRIMAGYLLHLVHEATVAVMYFELHTYLCGECRLSAYKDEWCGWEIMSLTITAQSLLVKRQGTQCTVFCLEQNTFAARSMAEQELWLRALGNVKVKLMYDAPDPSDEELKHIRQAVNDELVNMPELPGAGVDHGTPREGPLLPAIPRRPVPWSPRGDTTDTAPECLVEAAAQPSAVRPGGATDGASQESSPVASKPGTLPGSLAVPGAVDPSPKCTSPPVQKPNMAQWRLPVEHAEGTAAPATTSTELPLLGTVHRPPPNTAAPPDKAQGYAPKGHPTVIERSIHANGDRDGCWHPGRLDRGGHGAAPGDSGTDGDHGAVGCELAAGTRSTFTF